MTSSSLITLLHLIIFSLFGYTIYYDYNFTFAPLGSRDEFARGSMGGRFKFLTIINAVILQCLFFGLSFLSDVFTGNTKTFFNRSTSHKFLDYVFTTLVLPLGIFVSVAFWVLFAIDRDLIYPEVMDTWIPKWVNHVYHTLPFVSVMFEILLTPHQFSKGVTKKYLPLLLIILAYMVWVFYIAYKINFWVYPVFEVLNFPMRVAFILALGIPPFFFLRVGEKVNSMVWGVKQSLPKYTQQNNKNKNTNNKKNKKWKAKNK